MSELEVALRELWKDVEVWKKAAEVMEKAAGDVASVRDLSSGFGYLGEKAECDTTYTTLNDTLKTVAEQADAVFTDGGQKLARVILAYKSAEDMSANEVQQIRKGWHI